MKRCSRCKKLKSEYEFSKCRSSKDGLQYICKLCYITHKNDNNTQMKNLYGIDKFDYQDMIKDQGGRCLICKRHRSELTRELCVDHNHETGEIRGLICNRCNLGLGYFNEDPTMLRKAISYLERFN